MFDSVFNPEGFRPIFVPLGNEAGIDGIRMWRARLPDDCDRILPMIAVTTIQDDEVNARHEAGEDAFELLEQYTSWFWANDRASFVAAFRAARKIAKGGKVENCPARTLFDFSMIDGEPVFVVGNCSVHHVVEAK